MSVDHKRPLYAFIVVALVCSLVIADQVRSGAQWGSEAPGPVVASAELVPLSDPPVPGVRHVRRPAEQTAGEPAGEPAGETGPAAASPAPAAAAPAVQPAVQASGDAGSRPGRDGRGGTGNGDGRTGQSDDGGDALEDTDDLDDLDDLDPGETDDDVAPDEDDLDEVGQGQGAGHGAGNGAGNGRGPATALARLEHVVGELAGGTTSGAIVRALRSATHGDEELRAALAALLEARASAEHQTR